MIYDIVIIGAGPAGLTAAIYAARAGKKIAIIDREGVGGQMSKSPKIENFPGVPSTSGADLAFQMLEQITHLGVQLDLDEATSIERDGKDFVVNTLSTRYLTKSVIIATGAAPNHLPNIGSQEYDGNGIYYCAVCDGPLFKGKRVLVVGSGNSGAQYALSLNEYCREVTICDITPDLCCEKMMQDMIKTSDISIKLSLQIVQVNKNSTNEMVVAFSDGTELIVDGIFVAIGLHPDTNFVSNLLLLDNKGYIKSYDSTTSKPGIFAAGDCRTKSIRQIVTATSDGAQAALMAIAYVDKKDQKEKHIYGNEH